MSRRRKPTKRTVADKALLRGESPSDFRIYLKYVGLFALLMVLFQSIFQLPQSEPFIVWLSTVNARMAATLLSLLGVEVQAVESTLHFRNLTILTVERGCTGVEFFAILYASVFAFPCGWKKKLIGLTGSTVGLVTLNTLRVSSLYWVGIKHPEVFHVMHENWWSIGLTLVTVCLLAAWMAVASTRREPDNAA